MQLELSWMVSALCNRGLNACSYDRHWNGPAGGDKILNRASKQQHESAPTNLIPESLSLQAEKTCMVDKPGTFEPALYTLFRKSITLAASDALRSACKKKAATHGLITEATAFYTAIPHETIGEEARTSTIPVQTPSHLPRPIDECSCILLEAK